MKKTLAAAIACLALSGCLGYHIGPAKPNYLRDVHAIAIPTFENKTLTPRIEVLVTDTVIKQFQQDGTYRIVSGDKADATLKAEISRITRSPARSVTGNVLATSEFNLSMHVKWRLVGPDGKNLGPSGEAVGTTSFFVGTGGTSTVGTTTSSLIGDVTTDERQALPLAAEELANRLVTQLSEGW
ncbi:MAG TPA: LptE family protein [Chthoniobacterales bacterium]|nr:LptE family protein [Chthoniobacterales bacterium]